MARINRHLVVLGCGLLATAVLAYGGGLATAAWLAAAPALCEPPPPAAREDAGRAAGEPAAMGENEAAREVPRRAGMGARVVALAPGDDP